MSEPLCPFGDGSHKRRVWAGEGRSGFACVRCSKTWEWFDRTLFPTWPLREEIGRGLAEREGG